MDQVIVDLLERILFVLAEIRDRLPEKPKK